MLLAAILACLAAADETVVSSRRPADVDDVRLEGEAAVDPADALLSVPGVSLVREGGPLAVSRPMVRGLSGSRLDVSVLGLPFSDPAAGAVDAALLPWVLGVVDVDVGAGSGLGGSLALHKPAPGSEFTLSVGELSTLVLQGRSLQTTNDGVVGVAGSLGTSRGDFVFRAADAIGSSAPLLRRFNNEQQRASAAAFGVLRLNDDVTLRGAGVVAAHEGGIAGFATAPFQTLRGRRALGSIGGGLAWQLPTPIPLVVDVAGSVQGSERATTNAAFDDDDVSVVFGSRMSGRAALRGVGAGWFIDGVVDAAASALPETGLVNSDEVLARRLEVALTLKGQRRVRVGPALLAVDVEGGLRAFDDVGVLPTGSSRGSVSDPSGHLLGFVGVARAARAPTLDERFAPTGFVLGNTALVPESASEVEVGVVVVVVGAPGAHPPQNPAQNPAQDPAQNPAPDPVTVRVVAHASTIDDAIVIVNRSAFAVVPENTGRATRVGVDLGAHIAATPLVGFDVSAALLHSDVAATHAPLPGAPPFLLRLRARVGTEALHLDLNMQSRGASSSTIFGTLLSPAFTLVDIALRLPLADRLSLGLSMTNALDVLDARDTNLLPLAGRLFFLSLGVKV